MAAEYSFSLGFQELCCGRRPPIAYGAHSLEFPKHQTMPLLQNAASPQNVESSQTRSVRKAVTLTVEKPKVMVEDEAASRSTTQVIKSLLQFWCSFYKKLFIDINEWLISRRYFFFEMYNPSVTGSGSPRNEKLVGLILISSVLSILSSGFLLGLLMDDSWSKPLAAWLSQETLAVYLPTARTSAQWVLSISVLFLFVDYCVRFWIVVEGRPNCYKYYGRNMKANTEERLFWLTSPRVLLDLLSLILGFILVQGLALETTRSASLPFVFILNTSIRIAVLIKRSPGMARRRRIPLECLKESNSLHKAVVKLNLEQVEHLLTSGVRADDFVTLNRGRCHPRWSRKAYFENITPLMCAVECFRNLKAKSAEDMKKEGDRIIRCIGLLIDHGSNPFLQYETDHTWYSPYQIVLWGSKEKRGILQGLFKDAAERMKCHAKAIEFDLISAKFLRELTEETLPRRQDIEAHWVKAQSHAKKKGKFGLEEKKVFEKVKLDLKKPFRGRKIAAISHRWEQPDQPDPSGKQMEMIKDFLKSEAFEDTEYVFYDFWCLHQHQSSLLQGHGVITQRRKWHELAQFQHQLSNMYLLYAMAHVIVLVDLQYAGRAWPVFEAYQATRSISPETGVTRALDQSRYTIGQLHSNEISAGIGATIVQNIAERELVDIAKFIGSPEVFATNGKDKENIVSQLQSQENFVLDNVQHIV